jgi:protein-S-isoprenylcysteine O-methyltransferase Ste14
LIFIAAVLIGVVVKRLLPLVLLPPGVRIVAGTALTVLAVLVIVLCVCEFDKHQTNWDPGKPATALVTSGVYRYSRNPAYLAINILLLGLGILLDNIWIIAAILPSTAIMTCCVIVREERQLTRVFKKKYLEYRSSVRRWL